MRARACGHDLVLLCLLLAALPRGANAGSARECTGGTTACPRYAEYQRLLAAVDVPATNAAPALTADGCAGTDWKCLCRASSKITTTHPNFIFNGLDHVRGFHIQTIVQALARALAVRVRSANVNSTDASGPRGGGFSPCPPGQLYNPFRYPPKGVIRAMQVASNNPANPFSNWIATLESNVANGVIHHGSTDQQQHAASASSERHTASCSAHLPIYKLFPPKLDNAAAPPGMVREWLGNLRPWSWDCEANTYQEPYAINTAPSRAIDCVRGAPTRGVELPIVDEEYVETSDVLMAVASSPKKERFVIVEIGSRYAPFALRGLAASRQLHGASKEAFAVLVEPNGEHVSWIRQHFRVNGFSPSNYRIHRYKFGSCYGKGKLGKTAECMTLAQVLDGLEHVDLLDMDAQGSEVELVSNQADAAALSKVRRIHVETHSQEASDVVLRTLREHGFTVLRNTTARFYDFYHSAPTPGPLIHRDGSVYAVNPTAESTLHGTC